MTLRDDLIPVVDDIRQAVLVDAIGTRFRTVQTRLRTWSGAQVGGEPDDSYDATTTLEPRPRIRTIDLDTKPGPAGEYEKGDVVIDKISLTYTRAELDGGDLDPGQEWCVLIDGEEYKIIGVPTEQFLGWKIVVRRTQGR